MSRLKEGVVGRLKRQKRVLKHRYPYYEEIYGHDERPDRSIFNGLTFSAVAKVYYRMAKAVEENRAMRKKIGNIISALS